MGITEWGKRLKILNRIPFELILVVLALATQAFVVTAPANSLSNWYTTDDAFYYFKTAQNISLGHGVTFDGIGRASGFHPLWMLVCIPIFALAGQDLILPLRMLVVISVLLSAGTAIFIYRILSTLLSKEISALLSLFWIFSMKIHSVNTQLGMESGINAFFSALLIYLIVRYEAQQGLEKGSQRKPFWIGVAAVFTLFSRLDNIFLVFAAGVWLVFRAAPRLRVLLMSDLVLVPTTIISSFFLRVGFRANYQNYLESAMVMVLTALVVRPVIFYFFSLYQSLQTVPLGRLLLRLLFAVASGTAMIALLMLGFSQLGLFTGFPRMVIAIDWGITFLWVAATRLLSRREIGREIGDVFPLRLDKDWCKLWGSRIRAALLYFAPVVGMLGIYILWNYLYFGTPTPISGQIKHWWGTIYTVYGKPVATFAEFFGFPESMHSGAWSLAFTPQVTIANAWLKAAGSESEHLFTNLVAVFGTLFATLSLALVVYHLSFVRKAVTRLGIFPLFIGSYAQLLYYHGTNYVNTRSWYWVNHTLTIFLVTAVILDCLFRGLLQLRVKRYILQSVALILAVFLVVDFVGDLRSQIPTRVAEKDRYDYLGGIQALEKMTEPGSLIGS
ncbi:MAG: hypothetical protein U1B80_08890, partial [Anaerolineaceae bacterium]|nr:hypothetical protein [Anaerolineaceae bacterium]